MEEPKKVVSTPKKNKIIKIERISPKKIEKLKVSRHIAPPHVFITKMQEMR